ncbi:N/A [soil metagenome]
MKLPRTDSLAIRADGTDLSYSELAAEAGAVAQEIAASGAARGSLVTIDPEPGLAFAVRLQAIWSAGAVAWIAGSREEPLAGEDVAVRVETSGTTGTPRTVDLTHSNLAASAEGTAFALGVAAEDRWLCCLPVRHVAGLSILTRSAARGSAAVIHPRFEVERVAESLQRDGITLVSLVATQLARLLEAGVDLTGPRAIVMGGGPVPADLLDDALSRGAAVIQSYGMTETASQVALLPPALARDKAGSAGPALDGAEIRVDDGEVLVRGAMVSPSATLSGGWLRTGDLGRIDAGGCLWVDGRRGDRIITGGENVMPEEVEAALEAHPDVIEAAVIGRPDPEWQEAVTAVVVLRAGATLFGDGLRAHCAERLAGFKVPKRFEEASELPRTASGKLRRAELRRE